MATDERAANLFQAFHVIDRTHARGVQGWDIVRRAASSLAMTVFLETHNTEKKIIFMPLGGMNAHATFSGPTARLDEPKSC